MKLMLARFFICVLLIASLPGVTTVYADATKKLAEFHETIKSKFESVRHIDADQFNSMDRSQVIVFDVREQSEYSVSRIDGAVRVSPGSSYREFMKNFGERLSDKNLVFYCSVGYRSSALASRIQRGLPQAASNRVFNLQGGLFNWHNQQRELVDSNGTSDYIHPYDRDWGRLLEHQDLIRYQSTDSE